ncbi:MAG: hypothetical protein IPN95_32205 [Bacteroidetes bacterium]|nr:hypothetical protein [Bacteroidota bacterium]MBP6639048.1 hypothetical protein [Bacteroidia bacterium]MBP6721547.1 hypothetical protein [Bacteroidia bacterium]
MARYDLSASEGGCIFQFESIGPNGIVKKRIEFQRIDPGEGKLPSVNFQLFNLAYGDLLEEAGEFDDFAVSNNGDSEMVLATVASAIAEFLEHHPGALVFFEGSTSSRTRLYRMAISKHIERLSGEYKILGLYFGKWETFNQNRTYEAYLILRK